MIIQQHILFLAIVIGITFPHPAAFGKEKTYFIHAAGCRWKHISMLLETHFTLWTGKELFDTQFTLDFIQKKKNCFSLQLVSQKWVKDNRKCCLRDKCIDCNINYSSLEDFVSRSDLSSISIWFFQLRLICTVYSEPDNTLTV